MTDNNRVLIIDYIGLLASKRIKMKTYNIQVLVSIAEANDKEMDTAIPVVVTIPVEASTRDEAQKLFADTFSKLMKDTKQAEVEAQYRKMKELAASQPQKQADYPYHNPDYRWDPPKPYPHKYVKDEKYTLGTPDKSIGDSGSGTGYGNDSYGHSYGDSVSDHDKKGGYGPNH
jgi:hypothetical protein